MTIFRPKISEHTVQELHRLAIRENRSLTNMAEVAIQTGLRAMERLPAPPWARNEPTKPADTE